MINRRSIFVLILALSGCSAEIMSGPSESAQAPPTSDISTPCTPPTLDIKLTPAPPGETLLHRWQRTKADWEAANKLRDEASDKLWNQTAPAFRAYLDAESALKSAQCGQACVPENKP